ncbi:unnamed protein product [Urochloa decumbens]|uniref:Uncharacterized protein n=1 Tax=Urochloa decumbens TaxID=240449 RepID=A0ABC9EB18_9POAL
MDGGKNGARQRPPARGKGKAPAPPPPPPGHEEENGGGHQRGGGQKRQIWRLRVSRVVIALAVMIAAALYILFAEHLAVPPPSAVWFFVAFMLWIIGLSMLYSSMN